MFQPLLLVLLVALVAAPLPARAGDGVVPDHDKPRSNKYEARIDEMIGGQVALDVTLKDENDQPVTLKECVDGKPTIFVPVYYRCPMLCTEVLNGLLKALGDMPEAFTAGRQFNVVVLSMDSKEHGGLASEKKKNYLGLYGRSHLGADWRFLTGTKDALAVVLDSVGYRFEFDKMLKEYNHPSAIVILSPQGKVTRYFYGIGFDKPVRLDAPPVRNANGEMEIPTTTLRLSLIEAAEGKGGSLLDKLTLLCYRYDRLHQGYSLNVLRVVQLAGVLTLLAVGTGVLVAFRRERLLGAVTARVGLFAVIFGAFAGAGALTMSTTGVYRIVIGATFLAVVFVVALVAILAGRRHPAAAPTDTAQPSGGTA